jgi:2-polyprenyl-6-methoxyphenol hydroxylase-like FAD-dependent oxidoreductase
MVVTTTPDVVIVGAGIGGGAMATVLARAGLEVLLLEKTLEHRDVVRGEWIAPWGVDETRRLGLYELYRGAGAHHLARHVSYDEDVAAATCEAEAFDLHSIAPDHPGPLCLGHPRMCDLLNAAAVDAGATLLRGVGGLRVEPGRPPTVTFTCNAAEHVVTPRLVVGADGRNGVVARQIGCQLFTDPEHHLFSGMLVEGAEGWRDDTQAIGTEGDVNWLLFPQGAGRVRAYLGFDSAQRTRLLGPEAPRRFLEAFHLASAPTESIANATAVSRPFVYPNSDTWVDSPVRPGVVLVGDAAGRNDPIIGQGQSITHRDVRIVSELLRSDSTWSDGLLEPNAPERPPCALRRSAEC